MRRILEGYHYEIMPLTFGRARTIYTDGYVVEDSWEYQTYEAAFLALAEYLDQQESMNEPEGWIRHPPSGRRRPSGDPSKEYILY